MTGLWNNLKKAIGGNEGAAALEPASADEVRAWLGEGDTVLVDIREAEEHARMAVPGALSVPLSRYPEHLETEAAAARVVFHCQSGARTRAAGVRLAKSTTLPAYVLVDGLNGWNR